LASIAKTREFNALKPLDALKEYENEMTVIAQPLSALQ
jgi:hypothetical protein